MFRRIYVNIFTMVISSDKVRKVGKTGKFPCAFAENV